MKIYDANGYLSVSTILSYGYPFNIVIGNRACGKTFGSLDEAIKISDTWGSKFLYIRRTQAQADIISKTDFNPFKSICRVRGVEIGMKPITKYNAGVYYMQTDENGKTVPVGEPIGYTAALSTFSNLRGFDGSDIGLIIFDEAIPEKHERPIKNEAAAFFNLYETVNRNRELEGRAPVQCLILSNANDLESDLLMEMGLLRKAEKMQRSGKELYTDKRRGIRLYILKDTPIAEKKKDTALYHLTEGTDFYGMAINNAFQGVERSRIQSMPLAEYKPLVSVGDVMIYIHKSKKREYYVTKHPANAPDSYTSGKVDRARFRNKYDRIYPAYIHNQIIFEEYSAEVAFRNIYKN